MNDEEINICRFNIKSYKQKIEDKKVEIENVYLTFDSSSFYDNEEEQIKDIEDDIMILKYNIEDLESQL